MTEINQQAILTTVSGAWLWSTQNGVPASKQIRTNTGDWGASVTQLNISNTDNGGANRSPGMDAVKVGDTVRLEHSTDATRWATYTVTADTVSNTGYHTIPVTPLANAGSVPNNGTQLNVILQLNQAIVPVPVLNHMYIDLTMVPETNQTISTDLMNLIATSLQTVTHLVNHADFQTNVAGVILTQSVDILPAMKGPPTPLPQEVPAGA